MFSLSRLPVDEILDALAGNGAVSLSLIEESFRVRLLEEARRANFRPARASIGEGERIVYQRMEVCDSFPPDSAFLDLRESFQALWNQSFSARVPNPFESPVVFNDLMLQRYTEGRLGITPHRDRTAYRNVICLFVIEGHGRFLVCQDRAGNNAVEIRNEPGDLVLTRAPGCLGSGARPFHCVRDILSTRYVFGLRQDAGSAYQPARSVSTGG